MGKHQGIDKEIYYSLSRVFGSLVDRLLEKLYTPCSRHYLRVNTYRITTGELLDKLRENYPEYIFDKDPFVDDAIYIVVKGPYRVPVVDKKIVVDRHAAESIMLGAPVYRPGVIKYDDFKAGEEVNVVAENGSIVALARALIDSSKLKYMRKGVVAENIVSTYRLPAIREMDEYRMGLFYPQSLPAILVSHIIAPSPRETILDCCSSPGGKTSHLIQLSTGLARIVSIDRSFKKIARVRETLDRLKLPHTPLLVPVDARYLDVDLGITFDKALLDPPCTGLGVRPKVYIDKKESDLRNCFEYQKQFVKPVSRVVRENGLLVYSTCTLTYEENEVISSMFLEEGFESIEVELPYCDKVCIGELVAYRFHPLNNDMNGYYIAVFRKKT